jgi:hypothetical protein
MVYLQFPANISVINMTKEESHILLTGTAQVMFFSNGVIGIVHGNGKIDYYSPSFHF